MQIHQVVNETTPAFTHAEIITHAHAVEFQESTADFLGAILPPDRTGEARLEFGEREPAAVTNMEDLTAFLADAALAGDQPVLLTSPQIRPYVRSIIERFRGQTPVMSQNEVHPKARLKTVGSI